MGWNNLNLATLLCLSGGEARANNNSRGLKRWVGEGGHAKRLDELQRNGGDGGGYVKVYDEQEPS